MADSAESMEIDFPSSSFRESTVKTSCSSYCAPGQQGCSTSSSSAAAAAATGVLFPPAPAPLLPAQQQLSVTACASSGGESGTTRKRVREVEEEEEGGGGGAGASDRVVEKRGCEEGMSWWTCLMLGMDQEKARPQVVRKFHTTTPQQ